MLRASTAVVLFFTLSLAWGQAPAINYRGVVNAASMAPQGLPGGAIAQGSIFTISGSNLGPAAPVAATTFPLGSSLGGVSIRVFQGNTSVNALPLFVSSSQINAIMPSNAPLGMASVQVTYNSQASNASPVRVASSVFGIFAAGNTGFGPGILQNITAQNQPGNNLLAPATRNQTVTILGTGLGPITGADNVAPPSGNLPTQVEVFVGGQSAGVKSSGRSACCAGVDQITFTVPASAPLGCWVPVIVRTGGTTVSNAVTMAISSDGSPCSEPANPLAQAFIQGGNIGTLMLFRAAVHEDTGVLAPVDVSNDVFYYDFAAVPSNPFAYAFFLSQPPAGSCNLFMQAGDFWTNTTPPPANPPARLNPGSSFTLTGAAGAQNLTVDPAARALYLGTFAPFAPGLPNLLTLNPGNYTVSSVGGAAVGAFQAQLSMPATFSWTNRDQISPVDRTKPLTLTWTGVGPQQSVGILGGNVDLPTNSSAIFFCVAPPGSASFTVPAQVLNVIPAARANALRSKGAIYLFNMTLDDGAPLSVPGLDSALAIAGHLQGRTVTFQ